jgi:hypothetical protein
MLSLLLFCGCSAPLFDGTRDFIVVADINQVPDSDPFGMRDMRIEGDSLRFTASYGGGCRKHAFTLYVARAPAGTNTAFVHVQHNANHDLCREWIDSHPVGFSLRGLKLDLRLGSSAILRSAPGADSVFTLSY